MTNNSIYNGTSKDLRYINVDAAPGDPSTFWVSESGKYYRTYAEAKEDAGLTNVNPEDMPSRKRFSRSTRKPLSFVASCWFAVWW